MRDATHLRTFYFSEVNFCLWPWRDFCQPARVLLQVDLHWRQPYTPMGNATNLRTFCFKDHHYESFCLSRDSLSCATRSLDLCILFTFMFYTSDTLRPILALLTHFAYTDFFTCILSCGGEYFSHPWWCRWSARARNLILIFTFSSQRPHLNHI